MQEKVTSYPATYSVDYPDRNLNRLSTFFRIFAAIPICIVIAGLAGFSVPSGFGPEARQTAQYTSVGAVILPALLMILFRQKYPRWWFDWNLAFTRFSSRVDVYLMLMRDEYPSTDEEQAVHVDLVYPDAKKDLNRWLPLVKWFLAIPHLFILVFLVIAAFFCVIFAWFAILFTGRYPRSLFDYVVGVNRWGLRVSAYAFLLITDRYPPFSLDA